MKTLGIIGGLGPESTIDYYQRLIALYRERTGDGSYPEFIINSVNLKKGLDFMAANDLAGMADYLLAGIAKLARAGADFGLIAANTPHNRVRRRCAKVTNSTDQHRRSDLCGRQSSKVEAACLVWDAVHHAEHDEIPFLDTTKIHCEAAVAEMLS